MVDESLDSLNVFTETCDAGQFFDPTKGCLPCPKDQYSAAGNKVAHCKECPAGKGVESGKGSKESDCQWSEFIFMCFPRFLLNKPC